MPCAPGRSRARIISQLNSKYTVELSKLGDRCLQEKRFVFETPGQDSNAHLKLECEQDWRSQLENSTVEKEVCQRRGGVREEELLQKAGVPGKNTREVICIREEH